MTSAEFPVLEPRVLFQKLTIDPDFVTLRQLAGVPDAYFDQLYLDAIHRFARAAQLVPASETHHHARPGGLLEHTLDMVHISLQLRRGHKLPQGASPDTIEAESRRWTYAIFAATLLHDVGKLLTQFRILVKDQPWTPFHGDITSSGASIYRIEFRDSPYQHHTRMGASCLALLPSVGLSWLAAEPELFHQLNAYLSGQVFESGVFGEIVTTADRESVARDLKLDSKRYRSSRQVALIDRVTDTLRSLLAEKTVKRNRPGALLWTLDGTTYAVCRPLIEAIQSRLKEQGVTGIPSEYADYYDLLLEHGLALPTPSDPQAAIWSIQISEGDFSQIMSVLAFETRRVFRPTRLPPDFRGEIQVIDRVVKTHEVETIVDKTTSVETTDNTESVNGSSTDPKVETISEATGPAPAPAGPGPEDKSPATKLTWDDDVAEAFLIWVRAGILDGKLPVNKVDAVLHTLEHGRVAVVTPAAFKRFCSLKGLDDFSRLQKRFTRKKWNIKTEGSSQNVWPLWAKGKTKKACLNCWILRKDVVYGDREPPPANPFIVEDS